MTVEEQIEQMALVSRYANSLGLHGLLIASPVCEHCGDYHQFHMMSDLPEDETRSLLTYWTEQAARTPGIIVDEGPLQ